MFLREFGYYQACKQDSLDCQRPYRHIFFLTSDRGSRFCGKNKSIRPLLHSSFPERSRRKTFLNRIVLLNMKRGSILKTSTARIRRCIQVYEPLIVKQRVHNALNALNWEKLPYAANIPFDYHVFALTTALLSSTTLVRAQMQKIRVEEWFEAKRKRFLKPWHLPIIRQVEKLIACYGHYFELNVCYHFFTINMRFLC